MQTLAVFMLQFALLTDFLDYFDGSGGTPAPMCVGMYVCASHMQVPAEAR